MGCVQGTAKSTSVAKSTSSTTPSSSNNKKNSGKDESFKAVHSAVRWAKPVSEIEKLLVSKDDVNCVDVDNGNMPLHIAAQNGHTDIVALLIRKKAALNAKNFKGNTAIHMAVGYDYYDAAKLLIAAGADPALENDSGFRGDRGLEGDKTLGVGALICAKSTADVLHALQLCDEKIEEVVKVSYVSAGLKTKKSLGDQWTPECQEKFKLILGKL